MTSRILVFVGSLTSTAQLRQTEANNQVLHFRSPPRTVAMMYKAVSLAINAKSNAVSNAERCAVKQTNSPAARQGCRREVLFSRAALAAHAVTARCLSRAYFKRTYASADFPVASSFARISQTPVRSLVAKSKGILS